MHEISPEYQHRLRKDTQNFTVLRGVSRVRVGRRYTFVYPDFGTPVGYPDYVAHRFHIVTVVKQMQRHDARLEREAAFLVRAADGWEGTAFQSELYPINR